MAGVLVAASWGNPYAWGPARYVYRGVEAEARTSLAAVAEYHPASRILVLGVDTVYTARRGGPGCEPGGRPRGVPGSYRELVEAARRSLEDWIRACSGSSLLGEALDGGRLRVEVAPGAGSYVYEGIRYVFNPGGEPLGVYAAWAAGLLLEELLHSRPARLVIDVTHGVNYMPLGLVAAARAAAVAYAAATGLGLTLEIVNSEPYPLGAPGKPRLNIWSVEEQQVEPGEARDTVALELRHLLAAEKGAVKLQLHRLNKALLSGEEQGRLGREAGEALRLPEGLNAANALAAANIVLYSMPLAAAYLAAEAPPDPLETVVEKHREMRRLAASRGVLEAGEGLVQAGPALTPSWGMTRAAVYAASLLEAIHAAARAAGAPPGGVLKREGLTIIKLEAIVERLGSLYRAVAESELENLERRCASPGRAECPLAVGEGGWPDEPCDGKAVGSLDSRNLRAHAGLERNIVEARLDDGVLRIRYRIRGGDCWEKLRHRLGSSRF